MAGMFELFTDVHSLIRFRLLGPGGTVLAVSGAFKNTYVAARAIKDVRECAGTGLIEDHTAGIIGRRHGTRPLRRQKYRARVRPLIGSATTRGMNQALDGGLNELVIDSDDLECFLNGLARLAVSSLSRPGLELSCGLILSRRKKAVATGSSAPMARGWTDLQKAVGEGPSITAMTRQETVLVTRGVDERRWPRFINRTTEPWIGSVLAVALPSQGGTRTVLTLFAANQGTFTQADIMAAEGFAAKSSRVHDLEVSIADLRDTNTNLNAALAHRAVIDTALGVVMGQNRCSREQAFSILESASNTRNLKLHRVAASVIASVSDQDRHALHFDP